MVAPRSAPLHWKSMDAEATDRLAARHSVWTPRRPAVVTGPGIREITPRPTRIPLSPIEHLFFADDRPEFPMTFSVRLHFDGRIDPALVCEAAQCAATRHPLLCSVIAGRADDLTRNLAWIPTEVTPRIRIAEESDQAGTWETPIDPTREPPLRVLVKNDRMSSTIVLLFHHAATDGLGAMKFVEDLLTIYARLCGEGWPLPRIDSHRLETRGEFREDGGSAWRRAYLQFTRAISFVSGGAQPLASCDSPHATNRARTGDIGCEFSPREISGIKRPAKAVGATLNDLLLATFFQTLDRWNRSRGSGGSRLRVAMPINLRRPEDRHLPAANVITIAFLDRRFRERGSDSAKLMASIARETQDLKTHRAGCMMLRAARTFGSVPGGIRQLLAPRGPMACLATTVLSNMGPVLSKTRLPRDRHGQVRAGGVTLTRIQVLPPVRPGTGLSLGIVTYAGRMIVSAQHDPARLSPAAAELLLTEFDARLRWQADL